MSDVGEFLVRGLVLSDVVDGFNDVKNGGLGDEW